MVASCIFQTVTCATKQLTNLPSDWHRPQLQKLLPSALKLQTELCLPIHVQLYLVLSVSVLYTVLEREKLLTLNLNRLRSKWVVIEGYIKDITMFMTDSDRAGNTKSRSNKLIHDY